MKIISVWNNKGGVGKTTLSYHIAQGLALSGKYVLLIDNDPQLSLTTQCFQIDAANKGMNQIYLGEGSVKDYIVENKTIQIGDESTLLIVPGNRLFKNVFSQKYVKNYNFDNLLKGLLDEDVQNAIDYCIIDNNPMWEGPSANAIKICDEILIPTIPTRMDYEGLIRSIGFITEARCEHKINKIIPTVVKRTSVSIQYMDLLREAFKDQISETSLVDTALVPEVLEKEKVVFLHKYTSKYAIAMLTLIHELFPEMLLQDVNKNVEDVKRQKKIRQMFNMRKKREETKKIPVVQEGEVYGGVANA